MKSVSKVILILIAFLILATTYNHYSINGSGSGFCLTGEGTNSACDDVQSSQYGEILGMKVSILGVVAFAILFLIYLMANAKTKYRQNFYEIYLVAIVIATVSSIYFLSLQFFVLKQLCPNCLIIDTTTLIVAVLSYIEFKKRR